MLRLGRKYTFVSVETNGDNRDGKRTHNMVSGQTARASANYTAVDSPREVVGTLPTAPYACRGRPSSLVL